jgi:hypothetical protein
MPLAYDAKVRTGFSSSMGSLTFRSLDAPIATGLSSLDF